MASHSAERIDVQIVEVSALQARVRVSLPRGAFSESSVMKGYLYGPKSPLAETVPVRHPLANLSTAAALAGEAVIPEPCYTSDELPLYYEAHVEIHDGGQVERRTLRLELRPAQPPKLYE